MVFRYFLPGISKLHVDAQVLRDRGLGDVLVDCLPPRHRGALGDRVSIFDVAVGPTGSSGALVVPLPVDGSLPKNIGYQTSQTWIELKGTSAYWLGFDPQEIPGPASLRRTHVVAGYEEELGDGRVWTCPILRRPNTSAGQPNLPTSWGVDESGEFRAAIQPAYLAEWHMAGELWDVFLGKRALKISEAYAYAARCLAVNYRIGPHEATALNLIDSTNYSRVTKAAVDGPFVEEMLNSLDPSVLEAGDPNAEAQAEQKKSPDAAPDSPSCSPGGTGDSPITPRREVSCTSSPAPV